MSLEHIEIITDGRRGRRRRRSNGQRRQDLSEDALPSLYQTTAVKYPRRTDHVRPAAVTDGGVNTTTAPGGTERLRGGTLVWLDLAK